MLAIKLAKAPACSPASLSTVATSLSLIAIRLDISSVIAFSSSSSACANAIRSPALLFSFFFSSSTTDLLFATFRAAAASCFAKLSATLPRSAALSASWFISFRAAACASFSAFNVS